MARTETFVIIKQGNLSLLFQDSTILKTFYIPRENLPKKDGDGSIKVNGEVLTCHMLLSVFDNVGLQDDEDEMTNYMAVVFKASPKVAFVTSGDFFVREIPLKDLSLFSGTCGRFLKNKGILAVQLTTSDEIGYILDIESLINNKV